MTRQSKRSSEPKRRTSADYREEERARRAANLARKRSIEDGFLDDDFYEEDED